MREHPVLETGEPSLSEEQFRRFRDLIARRSGIYIHVADRDLLRGHLLARMGQSGTTSFADYLRRLGPSPEGAEFQALLDLITIQETYFFRDQAQFMALQQYVLPELLKARSGKGEPLRIWSAGCATGEEPYTIAMVLAESLAGVACPPPYILATDVSQGTLAVARRGVYGERSLRSTPGQYRERFFTRTGETYTLSGAIKGMVEFRPFNLMSTPYPGADGPGWDVIFCRNVTIYFKPETTKVVVRRFYETVGEGGYLFTGFSESLRYLSMDFLTIQVGGVFLYQRRAAGCDWVREPRTSNGRRRSASPPAPQRTQGLRAEPANGSEPLPGREVHTRARELVDAGQPDQAGQLLAPELAHSSPPKKALLLQAEILLNQGCAAEAAVLCKRVIRREPLSVAGHYLLGIIHRTLEDDDQAVEMFRRVVYLSPRHALARFHLGELYARRNEREAAQREYANAVRLLQGRSDSLDERFAGGFSAGLLIDTCRSRFDDLDGDV
jgi:chemotaxis protein methyltransferase CheR